ncbi:glycosyltransferase family 2 protein [Niabella ginsengisoli]|uniref:Glycosyltransferase family 2 protein n=1 Tax=Niabella ginsengisoli TaxID=522298 RepID=A0ABS9SHB8_9BACT|nr:glycosyltransferase family 2 protein [Niabella ginsengisoli]MCH5597711.1 glycosyltransferase family 2 protein [Niabella ginsengisoli]
MEHPSVAIVILNWNGKKYLEEFLPHLVLSTYSNYKIIVADNASTDDSVSFLQQSYPTIELIRLDENYGFAKGYNLALQQVQSDYYILLNSDVKVTPGWIEPMLELLENDYNIAACQPKMLSYNHPKFFEYAGAAGGWLDHYGYPFAMGRVFDVSEEDRGQYDVARPVFWATGAALFIRSEVFHKAGGFDNYFLRTRRK